MTSNLVLWATILAIRTFVRPSAALFFATNFYDKPVEKRIDPIISPGLESAHVHTVYGANGLTSPRPTMTYVF